jgi:hypothetical protein
MDKDLSLFLSIEAGLSSRVTAAWKILVPGITKKLMKAIKADDHREIAKVIAGIKPGVVLESKELRKYAELSIASLLLFGAGIVSEKPKTTKAAFEKVKKIAVFQLGVLLDELQKTLAKSVNLVLEQYEEVLRELGRGVVTTRKGEPVIEEGDWKWWLSLKPEEIVLMGLSKEALDLLMGRIIEGLLSGEGEDLSIVVVSLQSSRLAQYGALLEAVSSGISSYRVDEQLDNRTCPVCEIMHGQVFEVRAALERVDSVLSLTDANDLKNVAPWPKQNKDSVEWLRGLSSEELVKHGWDTPPYHPLCRGLLVPEG